MSTSYVRSFDDRAERIAAPQQPARLYLGKPLVQKGMILPYGRGGYRHNFGGCGCGGGMGATDTDGSTSFAILMLVAGAALAYALLRS